MALDTLLLEPWEVDALWLVLAFMSGMASRWLNLPPLIGFLFTGFMLGIAGLTTGRVSDIVHALSDLGVLLLLFTIGLKIKVRELLRSEVWATASIHMVLTILAFGGILFGLSFLAASVFGQLTVGSSLLIALALSFSSTVFVVKVLEDRGELQSRHGRIAIGMLVIQDIVAVLFLSFATASLPGWGVLLLPPALLIVRYVLGKLLDLSGHGELLTIFGFFATLIGGAVSFTLVGLKPGLGALVMGMLMVNHARADELYDRMMGFKDFFLIAFFLSIGLSGEITAKTLWLALACLALLPLKSLLLLVAFRWGNIRARTAFLTAISMSNYSEFGLIVALVALQEGLIPHEWMVALALVMSMSFLVGAPLNRYAHRIYSRFRVPLRRLNREELVQEFAQKFGPARFMVAGMGTVGLPTYQYLREQYGLDVCAVEFHTERVETLSKQGVQIYQADAADPVFWESANLRGLEVVYIAISDFESVRQVLRAMSVLPERTFRVAAMAHYEDQRDELLGMSVDFVYCYKDELGRSFAREFLEPA